MQSSDVNAQLCSPATVDIDRCLKNTENAPPAATILPDICDIDLEFESARKKTFMQLNLPSGETIAMRTSSQSQDLNLPQDLFELVSLCDFDQDGIIETQEVADTRQLLGIVQGSLSGYDLATIHKGIVHLEMLLRNKAEGVTEIDYSHFPSVVQKTFEIWDDDKSGTVSVEELQEAARASAQLKKLNKFLKIAIGGLVLLVLILMAGMFAMSLIASEIAKDMKPSGSVLKTIDGVAVQTASTEFRIEGDGSLVTQSPAPACTREGRCLQSESHSAVKVAQAVVSSSIVSTLPDETFQEMKSLQLGQGNRSLQLTITSWERVSVRSSRCGSVVNLHCASGRLTIDDTILSADQALENHIRDAGLVGLLSDGAHRGVGRRLSSDGGVKGFFNLIQGMEQECTTQPLNPPEDLLNAYHAIVRVKKAAEGDYENALSSFFFDDEGYDLPKPGYEVEYDSEGNVSRAYRTWTEEILKGNDLEITSTWSPMQPFMRHVLLSQSGGVELSLVADGTKGFHCVVTDAEQSGRRLSETSRLEFVGLSEEAGLMLRHFRLHLVEDVTRRRLQGNATAQDDEDARNTIAMVKAGLMPMFIDYFDIDTDPSGFRESGSPYRVRQYSTVPGNRVFTEKTYVMLKALDSPDELTPKSALEKFNVSWLGSGCVPAEDFNTTAAMEALMNAVKDIPVVPAQPPPRFLPTAEIGTSILYSYDRLVGESLTEISGGEPSWVLEAARESAAWAFALVQDPSIYREQLEDSAEETSVSAVEWENKSSMQNRSSSARRLLSKRVAADEEGEFGRRLRRRKRKSKQSKVSKFGFSLDHYQSDYGGLGLELTVEAGIASLYFGLETDWRGRVMEAAGSASGTAIIFPFPKLEVTMSGGISMTAEELAGYLAIEICAKILGWGICAGIEIGGALDMVTRKISELYGSLYLIFGKMAFTATITLTPIGCGNKYYKKWDVGLSLNLARESRFKLLRFDFDIDIFNIEVGKDNGCVDVRILSSDTQKQCIDTGHDNLACAEHAAMPGARLGDDLQDAEFKVIADGGLVCIERTDEESGWAMDFSIRCAKDEKVSSSRRLTVDALRQMEEKFSNRSRLIKMGSSIQNEKCVYSEPGTVCSAVDANMGRRLARDNRASNDSHNDSFNIIVKGLHANQVCVQRIDKSEGWNLDLRFLCYVNTFSTSRVVTIGSSRRKNTKCVNYDFPVTCDEDSGNLGLRLAERDNIPSADNYEETFRITVDRSKVCARRTDTFLGWGLNLRILCLLA